LKPIYTWLNENDFKSFKKRAEKRGETPYKYAQHLIVKGLEEQRQHEVTLTVAYWFLIYSIIVATLLVLF